MNAKKFVEVIKEVVSEGSIRAIQSLLFKPPGRKSSDKVVAMSEWLFKREVVVRYLKAI